MKSQVRNLILRYGLAVVASLVATWLRLLVQPYLGYQVPLVTSFFAVALTAWYGGAGPTLVAVVLSVLAAAHYIIPPQDSLLPGGAGGWGAIGLFACFGVATALASEWMRWKSHQVQQGRQRFFITLSSIGDGVIVTDEHSRVTFLNPAAEQMTGWKGAEADGRALTEIFRIIDPQTRQPDRNPTAEALQEGRVVGWGNPAILVSKGGAERPVEDRAAAIWAGDRITGVVLVFRDVSQQRASQIARRRLAALVDSSDDAIIGQTFDGIITDWNAGAERLFGYSADEVVGEPIFASIVPPDRKEELVQVLRRVQQGERVAQFETVRQRRDGQRMPVAIRVSPILDADGAVIGASAIDRDISQQRAAEQRRNARLAVTQILAQANNLEGAIAEVLAAVCSALQWDVGCFWRVHPEQHVLRCQEFWQEPSRNLEEFRTATMELALPPDTGLPGRVWKNRQPIWLPNATADPEFVRAPQAKAAGLHGGFACPVAVDDVLLGVVEWFSREIQQPDEDLLEMMATIGGQIGQFIERKNSEKAVRDSEQLYRAIGESIDYGVWVCDRAGRNIYASDSFRRLVGLTQEECSEFGWGQVLHPDDAEDTIAAWKECVRNEKTWYREHRFLGVDGHYHPILARGVPVRDEEGRLVCWAGINLDISRSKEVEDALRDADRRKDEFLAMLAHELRNPLAPIRSGLDLMAMDTEEHHQTVALMQEQVEHLVRLVDDLLDVSRITRGKVELRAEPVELAPLVKRAVASVRPIIDGHQQELVVSLPEHPVWMEGDPVRLVQVFDNLLNNAAKYTDAGGRIGIESESRRDGVILHVHDTGVGIEPELLPRVFELFTQSTRSPDRTQGGLGIGLTLVQRLVEMHRGTISAHSEGLNRGSTFSIRFPVIEAPPQADSPGEDSRGAPARKILVVDDNVGAASLLSMLLRKLDHHEVEIAHDGPAALEKITASAPEIVFLDIGLPGMDGYQVARTIREMPRFDDVLLVALTGYGQAEDREKSKAVGLDEHLVKPPSVEQLKELLQHRKLTR